MTFHRRMLDRLFLFLLLCCVLQAPRPAWADTIEVPGDLPSIQEAIVAAQDGDLVLVAAGIYVEELDFLGKAIVVRSVDGPLSTIVDPTALRPPRKNAVRRFERRVSPDGRVEVIESAGASGAPVAGAHDGTVVLFVSGEPSGTALDGFTIRGGFSEGNGGGIRIEKGAAPTLRNNIVTGNYACHRGAGIAVTSSSPQIVNNVIADNFERSNCSGGSGGGISIEGESTAMVRGNLIRGNAFSFGGGIALWDAGTPTFANNFIFGNTGSGFDIVNYSDALIVQNVIRDNTGDGVRWTIPKNGRGPFLISNSIANNGGDGVFTDGFDAKSQVVGNLIVAAAGGTAVFCGNFVPAPHLPIFEANNTFAPQGNAYSFQCGNPTGTSGNISADPLFADLAAGDLQLLAGSPSIDAGDSEHANLEPDDLNGLIRILDGNGDAVPEVDQGAYEFPAAVLVFADGFESGDVDLWSASWP